MTDPSPIEPATPPFNSRIELRVTDDGMHAFARIGAGAPADAIDVDAALHAKGIVHGIDPTAEREIAAALSTAQAGAAEIEIARGTPPGPSRDGWFEPAFQPGLQPGHVREDGTVDFHDRELLKPVPVGHVLGRLHPPGQGDPGVRVDGVPIVPPAGRALEFRLGPGTELRADGCVLATRAGVVIYVDARSIEIETHHVHEGDVDLHSGDLSMEGSLVVRSDVQRGFVARATGDLEIRGGVEGGSAYAGGNLRVFGGVRGSEGGMVAAEGNLYARRVERARLTCGGVMELGEAVNSELSAVQIRIERTLRGGRAFAEESLVTRDAGAPAATVDTVIAAGVLRDDPGADARHLLEAARSHRMAVRRAPGSRGGIAADRAHSGKLARELVDAQRGALARKIDRAQRMDALLPRAFVEVRGTAYPGVQVCIGDARVVVQDTMRRVRFTLDREHRTIRTEGIPK